MGVGGVGEYGKSTALQKAAGQKKKKKKEEWTQPQGLNEKWRKEKGEGLISIRTL